MKALPSTSFEKYLPCDLIFELRICWPISIADWVLGFTAACSFLWIGRWLQVWIVPLMSLIWRLYYKASILSTTLWPGFQNCVQKLQSFFTFLMSNNDIESWIYESWIYESWIYKSWIYFKKFAFSFDLHKLNKKPFCHCYR